METGEAAEEAEREKKFELTDGSNVIGIMSKDIEDVPKRRISNTATLCEASLGSYEQGMHLNRNTDASAEQNQEEIDKTMLDGYSKDLKLVAERCEPQVVNGNEECTNKIHSGIASLTDLGGTTNLETQTEQEGVTKFSEAPGVANTSELDLAEICDGETEENVNQDDINFGREDEKIDANADIVGEKESELEGEKHEDDYESTENSLAEDQEKTLLTFQNEIETEGNNGKPSESLETETTKTEEENKKLLVRSEEEPKPLYAHDFNNRDNLVETKEKKEVSIAKEENSVEDDNCGEVENMPTEEEIEVNNEVERTITSVEENETEPHKLLSYFSNDNITGIEKEISEGKPTEASSADAQEANVDGDSFKPNIYSHGDEDVAADTNDSTSTSKAQGGTPFVTKQVEDNEIKTYSHNISEEISSFEVQQSQFELPECEQAAQQKAGHDSGDIAGEESTEHHVIVKLGDVAADEYNKGEEPASETSQHAIDNISEIDSSLSTSREAIEGESPEGIDKEFKHSVVTADKPINTNIEEQEENTPIGHQAEEVHATSSVTKVEDSTSADTTDSSYVHKIMEEIIHSEVPLGQSELAAADVDVHSNFELESGNTNIAESNEKDMVNIFEDNFQSIYKEPLNNQDYSDHQAALEEPDILIVESMHQENQGLTLVAESGEPWEADNKPISKIHVDRPGLLALNETTKLETEREEKLQPPEFTNAPHVANISKLDMAVNSLDSEAEFAADSETGVHPTLKTKENSNQEVNNFSIMDEKIGGIAEIIGEKGSQQEDESQSDESTEKWLIEYQDKTLSTSLQDKLDNEENDAKPSEPLEMETTEVEERDNPVSVKTKDGPEPFCAQDSNCEEFEENGTAKEYTNEVGRSMTTMEENETQKTEQTNDVTDSYILGFKNEMPQERESEACFMQDAIVDGDSFKLYIHNHEAKDVACINISDTQGVTTLVTRQEDAGTTDDDLTENIHQIPYNASISEGIPSSEVQQSKIELAGGEQDVQLEEKDGSNVEGAESTESYAVVKLKVDTEDGRNKGGEPTSDSISTQGLGDISEYVSPKNTSEKASGITFEGETPEASPQEMTKTLEAIGANKKLCDTSYTEDEAAESTNSEGPQDQTEPTAEEAALTESEKVGKAEDSNVITIEDEEEAFNAHVTEVTLDKHEQTEKVSAVGCVPSVQESLQEESKIEHDSSPSIEESNKETMPEFAEETSVGPSSDFVQEEIITSSEASKVTSKEAGQPENDVDNDLCKNAAQPLSVVEGRTFEAYNIKPTDDMPEHESSCTEESTSGVTTSSPSNKYSSHIHGVGSCATSYDSKTAEENKIHFEISPSPLSEVLNEETKKETTETKGSDTPVNASINISEELTETQEANEVLGSSHKEKRAVGCVPSTNDSLGEEEVFKAKMTESEIEKHEQTEKVIADDYVPSTDNPMNEEEACTANTTELATGEHKQTENASAVDYVPSTNDSLDEEEAFEAKATNLAIGEHEQTHKASEVDYVPSTNDLLEEEEDFETKATNLAISEHEQIQKISAIGYIPPTNDSLGEEKIFKAETTESEIEKQEQTEKVSAVDYVPSTDDSTNEEEASKANTIELATGKHNQIENASTVDYVPSTNDSLDEEEAFEAKTTNLAIGEHKQIQKVSAVDYVPTTDECMNEEEASKANTTELETGEHNQMENVSAVDYVPSTTDSLDEEEASEAEETNLAISEQEETQKVTAVDYAPNTDDLTNEEEASKANTTELATGCEHNQTENASSVDYVPSTIGSLDEEEAIKAKEINLEISKHEQIQKNGAIGYVTPTNFSTCEEEVLKDKMIKSEIEKHEQTEKVTAVENAPSTDDSMNEEEASKANTTELANGEHNQTENASAADYVPSTINSPDEEEGIKAKEMNLAISEHEQIQKISAIAFLPQTNDSLGEDEVLNAETTESEIEKHEQTEKVTAVDYVPKTDDSTNEEEASKANNTELSTGEHNQTENASAVDYVPSTNDSQDEEEAIEAKATNLVISEHEQSQKIGVTGYVPPTNDSLGGEDTFKDEKEVSEIEKHEQTEKVTAVEYALTSDDWTNEEEASKTNTTELATGEHNQTENASAVDYVSSTNDPPDEEEAFEAKATSLVIGEHAQIQKGDEEVFKSKTTESEIEKHEQTEKVTAVDYVPSTDDSTNEEEASKATTTELVTGEHNQTENASVVDYVPSTNDPLDEEEAFEAKATCLAIGEHKQIQKVNAVDFVPSSDDSLEEEAFKDKSTKLVTDKFAQTGNVTESEIPFTNESVHEKEAFKANTTDFVPSTDDSLEEEAFKDKSTELVTGKYEKTENVSESEIPFTNDSVDEQEAFKAKAAELAISKHDQTEKVSAVSHAQSANGSMDEEKRIPCDISTSIKDSTKESYNEEFAEKAPTALSTGFVQEEAMPKSEASNDTSKEGSQQNEILDFCGNLTPAEQGEVNQPDESKITKLEVETRHSSDHDNVQNEDQHDELPASRYLLERILHEENSKQGAPIGLNPDRTLDEDVKDIMDTCHDSCTSLSAQQGIEGTQLIEHMTLETSMPDILTEGTKGTTEKYDLQKGKENYSNIESEKSLDNSKQDQQIVTYETQGITEDLICTDKIDTDTKVDASNSKLEDLLTNAEQGRNIEEEMTTDKHIIDNKETVVSEVPKEALNNENEDKAEYALQQQILLVTEPAVEIGMVSSMDEKNFPIIDGKKEESFDYSQDEGRTPEVTAETKLEKAESKEQDGHTATGENVVTHMYSKIKGLDASNMQKFQESLALVEHTAQFDESPSEMSNPTVQEYQESTADSSTGICDSSHAIHQEVTNITDHSMDANAEQEQQKVDKLYAEEKIDDKQQDVEDDHDGVLDSNDGAIDNIVSNDAAVPDEGVSLQQNPAQRKSRNIFSKVKHSLAKVKKAIAGKPTNPK